MDDLVKQISAKVGISEDQARSAAMMALDFVKTKLPPPIASQVDSVLGSGGGVAGGASGMLGQAGDMLGGMLGGKK